MGKKTTSGTGKPRRLRSEVRPGERAAKTECLCLECGISNYLELEAKAPGEDKIVANIFCDACGGPLLVRGRAGDEPCYPSA
jgi:hypothetical protein